MELCSLCVLQTVAKLVNEEAAMHSTFYACSLLIIVPFKASS